MPSRRDKHYVFIVWYDSEWTSVLDGTWDLRLKSYFTVKYRCLTFWGRKIDTEEGNPPKWITVFRWPRKRIPLVVPMQFGTYVLNAHEGKTDEIRRGFTGSEAIFVSNRSSRSTYKFMQYTKCQFETWCQTRQIFQQRQFFPLLFGNKIHKFFLVLSTVPHHKLNGSTLTDY